MTSRSRSPRRPSAVALLAVCAAVVAATTVWRVPAAAPDAIVATVTVGEGPGAVVANPATNKVYVANSESDTVSVIDGSSSSVVGTIPVGVVPNGLAVNPGTNRIYVANSASATVSVIDGATDTVTTTIATGFEPYDLQVNATTNKVYVADIAAAGVVVIDGATDTVLTTVAVGSNPKAIAVDEAANRVYVANITSSTVSVIDGATDTVTSTVATGTNPTALALNPSSGRVYVANAGSASVTVIDGTTLATTTVEAGASPAAIVANPVTNRVYVANNAAASVTVIDGASGAAIGAVAVGTNPVAIGLSTAANHVFVANAGARTLSVIDGASDSVAGTLGLNSRPTALTVNSGTNRAYVTATRGVTVVDPALPTPTTTTRPPAPSTTSTSTTTTRPTSSTTTTRPRSTSSTTSTTTPPPIQAETSRTAGADRYATATLLNADLQPGVPLVFVTTGEAYPDALAVGPIAGIERWGLVVVKRGEIPAATSEELERLEPEVIVIVGGTNAISAEVEQDLERFTSGDVLRVAGSNRYETATALSRIEFAEATTVHLVSGEGFADAVSAGQAAGAARGPILLTQPGALPDVVAEELVRLRPDRVVVVGGSAAVSPAVESEVAELLGSGVTVERVAGTDRYETAVALASLAVGEATDTAYAATGLSFADALAATPQTIRRGSPMVLVPSSGTVPSAVVGFVRSLDPAALVVVGGSGAVPDDIIRQLLG